MPGRVLGVVTEEGNHKLYNKSTMTTVGSC